MYAIIEDGSHQFRVSEGDHVRVNRRDGKAGDEVVFPKVLLIAGTPAGPTIRPRSKGAQVVAIVVDQFRTKKIIIQKFRGERTYGDGGATVSPTPRSGSPAWSRLTDPPFKRHGLPNRANRRHLPETRNSPHFSSGNKSDSPRWNESPCGRLFRSDGKKAVSQQF